MGDRCQNEASCPLVRSKERLTRFPNGFDYFGLLSTFFVLFSSSSLT